MERCTILPEIEFLEMNPLDTVFDVQNLPNQQNLENDENPPENWDAELITVPALPRRIFLSITGLVGPVSGMS